MRSLNSSKYQKHSDFEIGDLVYVRNFRKSKKFDPLFLETPFVVTDMDEEGNKLQVKQLRSDLTLWRHPDDLKRFHKEAPPESEYGDRVPLDTETVIQEESYDNESYFSRREPVALEPELPPEPALRRSNRTGLRNPRYFNEDFFVNAITWV